MALHRNIKKTLLHTFYYANNKITCIRCNLTGRFISKERYMIETRIVDFQHINNDLAKAHGNAFDPCLNVSAKELANSVIKPNAIEIDETFTLSVIAIMFFIVCFIHCIQLSDNLILKRDELK